MTTATTQPCRIRVLPQLLVNKIAAGEVVERPASVVKELIENALDAGATRIAVTIEDGGKQLVRVTDNGCGMSAEELRLSVHSHATSKLVTEEDLYRIGTLGFRGEALASISAVSKLRIVSRAPDALAGHEICVSGEKLDFSRASSSPVGTTVEVHDLFFNVPARRRFLRTPQSEVTHIHEQIGRAALTRPDVTFELTNNRRASLNLPACSTRRERIARFYGPELAEALIQVEREERGLGIEAYVAPPAQSRATQQWQYLFVNGRFIRDRFLQHAVKEAYRGLMEPNRCPVVFIYLTIDPANVDVNVHPTKIEVRWADAGLIHSQLLSALRETFQRADLAPTLETRGKVVLDEANQDRIRREMAELLKLATPVRGGPESVGAPDAPAVDTNANSAAFGVPAVSSVGGRLDPAAIWGALYGPPSRAGVLGDSRAPVGGHVPAPVEAAAGFDAPANLRSRLGADAPFPPQAAAALGAIRPRAVQMHNLYLVAETDEGIVIVDQHALHERVIYEQLRGRMSAGRLESQRLLLPETIRVTPQQSELLESRAELLELLGIEATPFGVDSIAVHAFPSLLKDTQVPSFMRDLLDRLMETEGGTKTDALINDLLSMMACKAAVKAGDVLALEEIEALIAQRHLLDQPSACPHGRPTTLRLTKSDLNRQFHRT